MKLKLLSISLLVAALAHSQQSTNLRNQFNDNSIILPEELHETSALVFFQGELFTLNDSGNKANLFIIEPTTGKIVKTLPTSLSNKDWESLAADQQSLYIGDFGNNLGSRKDLCIYKVTLNETKDKVISARRIHFIYPEQKHYQAHNLKHNFDGEAMIYHQGKIHIFTKEWLSEGVTHYIINPEIEGTQLAQKVEFFPIGYMVTDAAYDKGKLYLLGYNKQAGVFLSVFDEGDSGFFFAHPPKKYHLGSAVKLGQTEGLAAGKQGLYISSEAFQKFIFKAKQQLFYLPYKSLK